jgi:hypothetical protein
MFLGSKVRRMRKADNLTAIFKIMFLGSKVRRMRKADNLTAIYEPIV